MQAIFPSVNSDGVNQNIVLLVCGDMETNPTLKNICPNYSQDRLSREISNLSSGVASFEERLAAPKLHRGVTTEKGATDLRETVNQCGRKNEDL